MKRPLIGLTPLIDIERESYWMLPGYMKVLEEYGAVPVMLPSTDHPEAIRRLAETLDGFVFTGGHDVSLWVYGAQPEADNVLPCPERDRMECALLREVLKQDKPVLGICRGLQLINAALGGTLWQDLPSQHPGPVTHRQTEARDVLSHFVRLTEGSPLRELLGREELAVNSFHHQAVRTLAPSLKAAAISTDGLIEAAWMPQARFLLALQWHPEFAYKKDENSRRIAAAFVQACRE